MYLISPSIVMISIYWSLHAMPSIESVPLSPQPLHRIIRFRPDRAFFTHLYLFYAGLLTGLWIAFALWSLVLWAGKQYPDTVAGMVNRIGDGRLAVSLLVNNSALFLVRCLCPRDVILYTTVAVAVLILAIAYWLTQFRVFSPTGAVWHREDCDHSQLEDVGQAWIRAPV